MAQPNETSILSGSESASVPPVKKKSIRKPSSGVRAPARSASRRVIRRGTGPVEILFTQEPNPFREPVPPYIWIDYPLASELLKAPTYVIRLGVGGADLVEISIDKSPWLPCRLTSGYWWYDWAAIKPGKHTLVARMRMSDGRWFKTPPRQCECRPE